MKMIGDTLTVKIDKETRSNGYNPCPDGMKVTIVSFGEIAYGRTGNFGREPGIYDNRCWVNVKLPNGEIKELGTHCFEEVVEYDFDNKKKIRDLPETPFWEMDIVRIKDSPFFFDEHNDRCIVIGIEFHWEKRNGHYAYHIEYEKGQRGSTYIDGSNLELIERGKVWNYHHGLPLTFKDIRDEGDFYKAIGQVKEVKNPKTNNYNWKNMDDILDAIKLGIADGFYVSNFIITSNSAIKYNNTDVGKRIAQSTLKGFKGYLNGKEQINGRYYHQE